MRVMSIVTRQEFSAQAAFVETPAWTRKKAGHQTRLLIESALYASNSLAVILLGRILKFS